ncbi:hypothetical protein DPMN_000102 [Dreissena polymorpha]|uniref:AIG1-type G domain-containing protein n=1 Tax=Dreissena polymorpha TaxID=45954 RepID=A0A9D4MIC5_DREPO|nr:hypothetical protein DPMN_000102 [Dreissena polymorpha]
MSFVLIFQHAERWGKHIVITDTPGYFDTKKDNVFIEKQMLASIVATYPGFNAILFVIKAERITKEVQMTIDLMMKSFGANAAEFAYVVLTNIENEEEKNEYLSTPEPKLKQVIDSCRGKVLFIDNKADPKVVEKMAQNIVQAIAKESQSSHYKHECFTQVAQAMTNMGKDRAAIENFDQRKQMVESDSFLSALLGFVSKPFVAVLEAALSVVEYFFSK